MAGSVAKTIGAILLVLGILLIVGGIAAAAYAYNDDQQNRDRFVPSQRQHDEDQQIMIGGAVAIGLGVAVLIGGIVGLIVGGARRQGELMRGIRAVAPTTQTASSQTSTSPVQAGTGATAAPRTIAGVPHSKSTSGTSAGTVVGLVILGAAAILVVLMLLGGLPGLRSPLAFNSTYTGVLGDHNMTGSVRNSITLGGQTQMADSAPSTVSDTAPTGTATVELTFDWTPATAGTSVLRFVVEQGDGTNFTQAASETGGPGMHFTVGMTQPQLRIRAFDGKDGVVSQQDFAVRAVYMASA